MTENTNRRGFLRTAGILAGGLVVGGIVGGVIGSTSVAPQEVVRTETVARTITQTVTVGGAQTITRTVTVGGTATARGKPDRLKVRLGGFFSGGGTPWSGPTNALAERIFQERIAEIGGVKIDYATFDANAGTSAHIDWLRRMISEKNVDIYIGNAGSGHMLATAPVNEENGIIQLQTGGYSVDLFDKTLPKGAKFIFRGGANDQSKHVYAKWIAMTKPGAKVVTVFQDYAAGRSANFVFTESLKRYDPSAQILAEIPHPLQQLTDFSPIINQILALKPDFVFYPTWGGDTVNFINQALPFNLFNQTTVMFGWGSHLINEFKNRWPEGTIVDSHSGGWPTYPDPSYWPLKKSWNDFSVRIAGYPIMQMGELIFDVEALKAAIERAIDRLGYWPDNLEIAKELANLQIPTIDGYRGFRPWGPGYLASESTGVYIWGRTKNLSGQEIPILDPMNPTPRFESDAPPGVTTEEWLSTLQRVTKG